MTLQQFNPTLQALEKKSSDLSRDINDLKDAIAELKSEKTESSQDFPQLGQQYYYVDECGDIDIETNDHHYSDEHRTSIGNCFRTREEAKKYKLRLESMKPKYLPEVGDEFYGISYLPDESMIPAKSVRIGGCLISPVYLLGRTFKTYEQAQEWINKYQDAWRL